MIEGNDASSFHKPIDFIPTSYRIVRADVVAEKAQAAPDWPVR
jgi:hypothetical protein